MLNLWSDVYNVATETSERFCSSGLQLHSIPTPSAAQGPGRLSSNLGSKALFGDDPGTSLNYEESEIS